MIMSILAFFLINESSISSDKSSIIIDTQKLLILPIQLEMKVVPKDSRNNRMHGYWKDLCYSRV